MFLTRIRVCFYYHIANINTKIKFNKFFNNYFLVFFNFFEVKISNYLNISIL